MCKLKNILQILLLIIIVIICYANSLSSPFVWDDEVMIVENPLIRNFSHVSKVFSSSAFGESLSDSNFYRPIQILTYMWDYFIWKLNPIGYHITNIMLHLLTVMLVLILLRQLGLSRAASFITSALFAVHPINIEAVTYISGRGDLLYLLFCLASFSVFLMGVKKCVYKKNNSSAVSKTQNIVLVNRWSALIISLAFYFLALLSKENAVTLPLIIGLYILLFKNRIQIKPALFGLAGLISLMTGFTAIRLTGVFTSVSTTLSHIASADLMQRIFTLPYIIWTYFRLLLIPYPLHMEYHYVASSILNPYLILGMPLLIGAGWVVLRYVKPVGYVKPANYVLFGFGWFFIALGPVYNVLVVLASTVREHWASFPGLGILLIAGLLIEKGYHQLKSKKLLKILFICLVILYIFGLCISTIIRNIDWQDPMRLYTHDAMLEPRSVLLYNNIGVIHFRNKDYEKAKQAFQQSIDVSPGTGYATAYNNLGVILENQGDITNAVKHYKASIVLGKYELAYVNYAGILLKNKESIQAITLLKQGLTHYPNNPELYYFLGHAYLQNQQFPQAYQTFENVQTLAPGYKNTQMIIEGFHSKQ
ncbi:tetratricopeptide repeat protein [Thermoproteota archaeon]